MALLLLPVILLGSEVVFAAFVSRETAEKASWVSTAIAPAAIVITGYLVKLQLDEAAIWRRGQLFEATASRILDLDKFFYRAPDNATVFFTMVSRYPSRRRPINASWQSPSFTLTSSTRSC